MRKILIPIGIIALGIFVLVIMTLSAHKPQKKDIIEKAPLVEAVDVRVQTIRFEIASQGSVEPRTVTTLVSEVSGQIKSVSEKFVVGGFFSKGEQLLKIDPISYQVALLQAQARLDGANAKLVEERARGKQAEKEWSLTGRAKKNAPILALRKPQLQQALADVKAAQADVKSAQIKLDRTVIVAPYDAMLKSKAVDIGQYVSTGTPLATTFAVDYAEIRLPVKEEDLVYINIPPMGRSGQNVQQGSQVELYTAFAGKVKKWRTYITRSEGVVDATSRVNYVIAKINDPYGLLSSDTSVEKIRMGTFVKAKIIGIETENVVAIPRKAVRAENQIYLLGENRQLDFRKLDILRSDVNNVYILGGLNQGEKIVTTKLTTAVRGMNLRLKGEQEPSSTESLAGPIEVAKTSATSVASKPSNGIEPGQGEEKTVVEDDGSEQPKTITKDIPQTDESSSIDRGSL
jgi:RND family efflux transporter MFP subunit